MTAEPSSSPAGPAGDATPARPAGARIVGRFAPSPTGALHLGNLRTALVAWLAARADGGGFIVRMEDLDRVTSSRDHERGQLADLAAIGLDWDETPVRQSERFALYEAAIDRLTADGLTYPCFCTRREIREAASAPHNEGHEGAYPGTCRRLTRAELSDRERSGRQPATRLRAMTAELSFVDGIAGRFDGSVDDVVLRRNDGVPAYNLAVVVDDAAQGVNQVVRGDDLLSSTPRQIHLHRLLDLPVPAYLHLPLALAPTGERLAKRHGPVTLADLGARGVSPQSVLSVVAESLGLAARAERVTAVQLIKRFDPHVLPRQPWVTDAADAAMWEHRLS